MSILVALLLALVLVGSDKSLQRSHTEINDSFVSPDADLPIAQSDSSLNFKLIRDGTVHAIDSSGKYFWSFSSGDNIEPDSDQTSYDALKKYISETPFITDGEVVIGSSLKSVFLVDPESGKLIHKFDINGTKPFLLSMTKDIKPLFFERVDHSLQCFEISTGSIKWTMKFSELASLDDFFGKNSSLVLPWPNEKTTTLKLQGARFTPIIVEPDHYIDYIMNNTREILALPGASGDRRNINNSSNIASNTSISKNISRAFPVGWLFGAFLTCVALLALIAKGILHFRHKKEKEQQKEKETQRRRKRRGQRNASEKQSKQVEEVVSDQQQQQQQQQQQDQDGKIGNLTISKIVIGYGSHGTRILEGRLDKRPVAVKSILSEFYVKASQEIAALIELDAHPSVVRYYAMEQDKDFVYIALERCSFNLETFILVHATGGDKRVEVNDFEEKELQEILRQNFTLWDKSGLPSPLLMKLMREVLEGLVHLHRLGYVHRDLKPQNVLILRNGETLCAKISDMGISKRLNEGASAIDKVTTGLGSSGWQAPEQLHGERQTRAVDMFTVGCLLYFCITGGQHPFGGRLERDMNIVSGKPDLFAVDHFPEAMDVVSKLLAVDPKKRPTALQLKLHPFFWSSQKRLQFLIAASDRVEREDREANSTVLAALEAVAPSALGGAWNEKLDSLLIDNLGRYRQYNYQAVRDLLRVIRNKANHYRELPLDVQQLLGSVPQGYESYFRRRFPKLLMEVFNVLSQHCWEEEMFEPYFSGEADL